MNGRIVERFLAFFCGIGGLAATRTRGERCTGIDINRRALDTFQMNAGGRVWCRAIESLTADEVCAFFEKDDSNHNALPATWWMSPPCQPHTARGLRRDLDDPRSAAFRNVVRLIEQLRPDRIALENVPQFADSDSLRLLCAMLDQCGYDRQSIQLCPTQLGAPNRRMRFYLIAAREKLLNWKVAVCRPSSPRLEQIDEPGELTVDESIISHYLGVIHIVDKEEYLAGRATTGCFTAAYGRSPVRSGSYLREGSTIRRFSPREILWQLGFPAEFRLPDLPARRLWPLVGNSLSLPAVDYVLSHFPRAPSPP